MSLKGTFLSYLAIIYLSFFWIDAPSVWAKPSYPLKNESVPLSGIDEETEEIVESKINVSLMLGPSTYVIGRSYTDLIYEFAGAYRFLPKWEFGLEYGKAGLTHVFGADINYYATPLFFVGIQAGIKTDEYNYFYFGPQVGYDFLVAKHFTIGPEFEFLGSFQDQSAIVEFLSCFKYHF